MSKILCSLPSTGCMGADLFTHRPHKISPPYCKPPWRLIPRVLNHVEQVERYKVILLAAMHLHRPWWHHCRRWCICSARHTMWSLSYQIRWRQTQGILWFARVFTMLFASPGTHRRGDQNTAAISRDGYLQEIQQFLVKASCRCLVQERLRRHHRFAFRSCAYHGSLVVRLCQNYISGARTSCVRCVVDAFRYEPSSSNCQATVELLCTQVRRILRRS